VRKEHQCRVCGDWFDSLYVVTVGLDMGSLVGRFEPFKSAANMACVECWQGLLPEVAFRG